MKRYSNALLIIGLILLGAWALFDDSEKQLAKAKSAFKGVDAQIRQVTDSRETYTQKIVKFNEYIRASGEFLSSWYNHYLLTRDVYEELITQTAEESGCVVVERNWNEDELQIGKLDYDVQEFKGKVVGDYRNIVKFIGLIESNLQFSLVKEVYFQVGVSGVTCSVTIYLPKLAFEGVVL